MSIRDVFILVAAVGVAVPSSAAPGAPPSAEVRTAGTRVEGTLDGAQVQSDALPAGPLNPYTPPPCSGIFADVACPGGFAVNWIEQFYNDGITSGCGTMPLTYCPDNPVTRAQMAVFVEKAVRGTGSWSPGNLGSGNTGLGASALLHNSSFAQYNTAVGDQALLTQSFANAGVGYLAVNTAVGHNALYSNQPDSTGDGVGNTAVGVSSLANNATGAYNVAVGIGAGQSYSTGAWNTFLGSWADTAAAGFIDAAAVGSNALVDASYHVRIGDNQVTQIGGQVAWSNLSDARAKNDIRDLDLGLDFVMQLRPVSFTLKQGNGRTDMGFVAQDVEALLGDGYNVLGIGGDEERTLSLRYTDLIAPMVKAIQEQQATIQAEQAQLAAKDARIAELETRQTAQDSRIEALLTRVGKLEAAGARR